eukprot:TRINITY_DN4890_c0_g1_i5.p1 TRINITY_DN4890_c0_g1~~TRINITY_DN4890_c0_g1_i5.p1  ORF type:complete len:247 (+),score=37.69 TRINITY_DN4890_c0_g1_i5:520-1260(+)
MDFSSVKLKKVEVQGRQHTKNVTDEAEHYHKSVLDTNVESWYPYLKDFTMKTWFLELTPELAKIFLNLYLHWEKNGPTITKEEEEKIIKLESQLSDCIMEAENNGSEGVFVRCSTRSPKDSQVSRSRCREILISELTPGASSNDKLTALLKAALGGMRSRTAKEAIQLLTTSERIYEDLSFELENSSKFHQFIIVREWKNIPVEHEYRGFVCGKKLNAISQFCHLLLLFPGCHYSCHLQVHDFHNK